MVVVAVAVEATPVVAEAMVVADMVEAEVTMVEAEDTSRGVAVDMVARVVMVVVEAISRVDTVVVDTEPCSTAALASSASWV